MLSGNDIIPKNTFGNDLVALGLAPVAAKPVRSYPLVLRVQQGK